MKDATITFTSATKKRPAKMLIKGQLTLANAEPIRQYLLKLLGQPGRLVIRIDDVTDLDIAFIQLLYALRHSTRELGKLLDLTMNLTPDQQLLVDRAGLNECTQVIEQQI